jgi:hypothetical protein
MSGVRLGKDKREDSGIREDGGIKKRHVRRQHLLFLAFIVPNFLLLAASRTGMVYQSYLSPALTKVTRKCNRNTNPHLRE